MTHKRKSDLNPDYYIGDRVEFQLQRGPRRGEWLRGIVVERVPPHFSAETYLPTGLGFNAAMPGPVRDHLSFLIRRDGAKPCKSVYWPPVDAIRRAK